MYKPLQRPHVNPERPCRGYDGPPPSLARSLSVSETKLEIADFIAVTERGSEFLFAVIDALQQLRSAV